MRKGRWHGNLVVFAGALLMACGGATSQPPKPATTPTPAALMDAEPETPWSACLGRITTSSDPAASVEKIGRTCGTRSGQRALSPVRTGQQTEAESADRYTFRADRAGTCFRVYAIGGEGVEDIDVEVVDPAGRVVATDDTTGPLAAAPYREPLCVESAGVFTVEVTVTNGGGSYALQVWSHHRTVEEEDPLREMRPRGLVLPPGPDSDR